MLSQTLFALLLIIVITNADNPCLGINSGFVDDETSCYRYFSCVNGIPHLIECPDGRHFRPEPPACVLASESDCNPCPATGVVAIGIPGSCTLYILCINGLENERECAPGTYFDTVNGRCDLQENVVCEYSTCPADVDVVIMPDRTSCSHYFVCMDGVEVVRRECAPGLLFSPELGCSREEDVDCSHVTGRRHFIPQAPEA